MYDVCSCVVDGQGSYTNAAALSSITARAAPSASTVAASVRPATPARRRATTRNASDETVNGKLLHVCFRFRVEFSCASDRSVLCPRFATYIGCINPIVFSATLTTTMAIKKPTQPLCSAVDAYHNRTKSQKLCGLSIYIYALMRDRNADTPG